MGVISLAVLLKDSTTGSEIGMALNVVLVANTTLLRLVESWTNLEISLGAIARLKSLESQTPNEDASDQTEAPDGNWPSHGAVEMNDVSVAYG